MYCKPINALWAFSLFYNGQCVSYDNNIVTFFFGWCTRARACVPREKPGTKKTHAYGLGNADVIEMECLTL